jgi:two-component system, NarL family, nitrate/nitrite response regulator NarL
VFVLSQGECRETSTPRNQNFIALIPLYHRKQPHLALFALHQEARPEAIPPIFHNKISFCPLQPDENRHSHFENLLRDFVTSFLVNHTSAPYNPRIVSDFVFARPILMIAPSNATSNGMGVLLADSNRMQAQLLTSALRRHSEFHITHCQMDSSSILQAVSSKPPRIAVLSLNRSGNASETVMTLRRFHLADPDIPKILLVESSDRELVISAFRSGARGIFSIADANHRLLCKCLLRVAAGQIWANTEQLNYAMDPVSEVPSLRVINARGGSLLTPREEQVVALVAEGLGNRQIAGELNLSQHTIKKYLSPHLRKVGRLYPRRISPLRRE